MSHTAKTASFEEFLGASTRLAHRPADNCLSLEDNILLAKHNLTDIIWKEAQLEGIDVTYAQTVDMLEGHEG